MLAPGHPVFTLALVLVIGVVSGWAAKRVRLPAITGQIVAGVALGPSLSGLFSESALHELRPLTHFALGLVAVAVGNHLNFKRLRRFLGKLTVLIALEVTITPILVLGAMRLGGVEDWGVGALFATMAIATAPATVVAIVAEARARGRFVKTLMAAVALNNMACILLFEVSRGLTYEARTGWTSGALELIGGPLLQLVEPLGIGLIVGVVAIVATRNVARSDLLASLSMIAILFTAGISDVLGVSPLLACLFLGVALANITPDRDEIGHRVFRDFEYAIFAVFFTLAGMELDFAHLAPAALLAGLFVMARFTGKLGSAWLAMRLAGASEPTRRYLGLALIPQAGVAVGLVLLVQDDPALQDASQLFLAVGITAVTANEILGPLTTRWALMRSGDAGKDRPNLIDFLHEEHILTDLGRISMDEAVTRLTKHLYSLEEVGCDDEEFLQRALEHDGGESYLGHGLSIPHVRVPRGNQLLGVMGISKEGLDFRTPDGSLVHCVVLLATPPGEAERHLEVLAAFSRAIGGDRVVQLELYRADSPGHAYELLHADRDAWIDQLLEEDEVPRPSDRPPAA